MVYSLDQFVDAGRPSCRVMIGCRGDVVDQQLVVDPAPPARRQGLPKIAGQNLKEQYAEREDVAAHRGGSGLQQFRRQVHQGSAAAVRVARDGHAIHGEYESLELFGFKQLAVAEITQFHVQRAVRAFRDQNVVRLDVLVQHADAVRGRDCIADSGKKRKPLLPAHFGKVVLSLAHSRRFRPSYS